MRVQNLLLLLILVGCQAEGRLSKVAKETRAPSGGAAVASSGIDTVHATVSYRQETLLPTDAHVKVALVDVARTDGPATIISTEDRVTTGKQVPFRFALPFVLDQIPMEARLAVRATIEVEGKVVFTSTEIYPVVTQGAPKTVDLVLQPVR